MTTNTTTEAMTMATAKTMTASDFLAVRAAVAEVIRSKQPRSEQTERQAEALMEKGWIDTQQVLADLKPRGAVAKGGTVPAVDKVAVPGLPAGLGGAR